MTLECAASVPFPCGAIVPLACGAIVPTTVIPAKAGTQARARSLSAREYRFPDDLPHRHPGEGRDPVHGPARSPLVRIASPTTSPTVIPAKAGTQYTAHR